MVGAGLDALMSAQWYTRSLDPEEVLMVAVVAFAIEELQKYAGGRGKRHHLWQQARGYLTQRADDWPYDFEHICDHFGWDAQAWRAKMQRFLGVSEAPLPAVFRFESDQRGAKTRINRLRDPRYGRRRHDAHSLLP